MQNVENISLPCKIKNIYDTATLSISEIDDKIHIFFCTTDLFFSDEGDNCFDTLVKIRKKLEENGISLLCMGCCRNVYPSGMILSMGTGRSAYVLTIGRQATMKNVVDIFEPCPEEKYATIQEQKSFFDAWTDSL